MASKVGAGALVLVGRNKAQRREPSPQTISEEQIETFFAELADTWKRAQRSRQSSARYAHNLIV